MPRRAILTVMSGLPDQAGQTFEITQATTTLGRSLNCDIQLAEQSISRTHAELVWEGDSLYLVHRSAVNRTVVNGTVITDRVELTGNDEIQLADVVTLRVRIEPEEQAAVAAEGPAEAPGPEATALGSAGAPQAPSSSQAPPSAPPAEKPAPPPAAPPSAPPAAPAAKPAAPAAPPPKPAAAAPPEDAPPTPPPATAPKDKPRPPADKSQVNVAIIGAGPAGIAAAVRAAERGITHTLYERSVLADTIVKYQKGKLVMAEPPQLPLQSDLKMRFEEGRREQILEWWSTAVQDAGANLVEGCEILRIEGGQGDFTLHMRDRSGARSAKHTHVVLSIGVQGDLRKFGVPGDDQPWVTYQLDDPKAYEDKRCVVVGVGDAGIENAMALAENGNEVTVVNRRDEIVRAKPMNKAGIESKIKSGEINYIVNASPDHFDPDGIVLRTNDGQTIKVECDLVIGRLGATPPRSFLESIGIVFPSKDKEAIPDVSEAYESNARGIFMVGALVGYPLIKNCMNQGFEVIEHILGEDVTPADEPVLAAKFRELSGTVSEILDKIRNTLPTLMPLTSVQLRDFMFDSNVRVVNPGEVVYRRKAFDDSFFSILEGTVITEHLDNSDESLPEEMRPIITGERSAGQFFGEEGVISGRKRDETVTAKTRCVLIETPRLTMLKLIRSVDDVSKVIDQAYINGALASLIPALDPKIRKRLAYRAEIKHYAAGTTIFSEGDAPDGLHFIRRGSVRFTKQVDGVETGLPDIRAGNTMGEMAILKPNGRRTATARASVDIETVLFSMEDVREFLGRDPAFLEYLRRKEQEFTIADARLQGGRGTQIWFSKQGAKEATDLLMIDEALCVRCDNCEKACAETHFGVSRLNREAGATYMTSSGSALHLPTACQHCENPKCMTDCPTSALKRDPDGEVWIESEQCIGCGNCEAYCPYNVIKMSVVSDDPGPGLLMRLLFPTRATKKGKGDYGEVDLSKKKAVKCDLCRELPDKRGGAPRAACVASCPTGAIVRIDPTQYGNAIYERQG